MIDTIKTVVIYKTRYGHTERYAAWIANELNAGIKSIEFARARELGKYTTIVYGGGIYKNKIDGISFITDNFEEFKDKKVIVFTVGFKSTDDKNAFLPMIEKTFSPELREKIHFFYIRGGIFYKKLNPIHKCMVAMFIKQLKNKDYDILSDDEKLLLNNYKHEIYFTDTIGLDEVMTYIKSVEDAPKRLYSFS